MTVVTNDAVTPAARRARSPKRATRASTGCGGNLKTGGEEVRWELSELKRGGLVGGGIHTKRELEDDH